MNRRTDKDYLNDIKKEIELIESILEECTYEEYLADIKIQHIVERAIEIISEASKHIQPGYKNHCTEIQWDRIKSMRNIVAHEYMNIDLDIMWNTINNELTDLKDCINYLIEYLS